MLSKPDRKHLLDAISANACILLLGAGFSSDATNSLGEPVPTGYGLARSLWLWLGYEPKYGPYTDAPLDRLFDIARKAKGDAALLDFLRDRLLVRETPDWYSTIAGAYWHRVYTTNVDDLVEGVYRKSGTIRLDVINGVSDRYRDRDPFLSTLQYVKLNGSISQSLDGVTFGARQYGKRSSEYDVWYDRFVRDYSQHVTLLVGTRVNEPLFWRAVESRQGRHGAAKELRLRSFLVTEHLDPVVLHSLDDFNVVPIQSPASEFFKYLVSELGPLPAAEDILQRTAPELSRLVAAAARSPDDRDALESFLRVFSRVAVNDPPRSNRSLFHQGATPDWDDLALGLDAQREITGEAQAILSGDFDLPRPPQAHIVTGHRGAGKSTLSMRCSLNLTAAGKPVFFAVGEDVPDPYMVARAVDATGTKLILVIDDAEWVAGRLDRLWEALQKCRIPPVLVAVVRANSLHTLTQRNSYNEIWLRELTDPDIEALIDVLEKASALGVMTGQPRGVIRDAFKARAKKQLLVALKEVTTGNRFDEIIRKEFQDIGDHELRVLYTIACLATDAGASLNRGQLIASSPLPPALVLSALDRELNQVLLRAPEYGDRVIARHPVIALSVVEHSAPKTILSLAYQRILAVLANDMDSRARKGEPRRWFRLYKTLINHKTLYHRFQRNIDEAREIFDSAISKLSDDAHFWVQYGSLELEYGELDLASRYIDSAEGLAPDLRIVRNTKAHLLFALAVAATSIEEAVALKRQAVELCEELIDDHGDESDYPWHILISHNLEWLEHWERDIATKRAALEGLRERAIEALEARPRSDILTDLRQKVERSYLATALT